jgi:hypothetical protein
MSRGLFRLVGVRSGCWVVRDKYKDKKVQIVISCAFSNKKLMHFVGIIIV